LFHETSHRPTARPRWEEEQKGQQEEHSGLLVAHLGQQAERSGLQGVHLLQELQVVRRVVRRVAQREVLGQPSLHSYHFWLTL
jgi:hypothetical protein